MMAKKEQIEKIVAAGLIVVFAVIFISTVSQQVKRKRLKRDVVRQTVLFRKDVSRKHVVMRAQSLYVRLEEATAGIGVTDDPFSFQRLPVVCRDRPQEWVLSGILFSQNQKSAVLNDAIVVVGQEIGQYKVSEIRKESVVITGGQREITLTLP